MPEMARIKVSLAELEPSTAQSQKVTAGFQGFAPQFQRLTAPF
jgi:hypothetical protein